MKTNEVSLAKISLKTYCAISSRGMWFRRNAALGGISLHRNKPRCGVFSLPLRASRLAAHHARYGFERCL